jgi:hypothetical protein
VPVVELPSASVAYTMSVAAIEVLVRVMVWSARPAVVRAAVVSLPNRLFRVAVEVEPVPVQEAVPPLVRLIVLMSVLLTSRQ